MDNGSQDGLTLRRMPQGGFLVSDDPQIGSRGMTTQFHFASTSIDDALKFMRDKINPITPEQEPGRVD